MKQRLDNRISFLGIAAVLVIICDIASFALLFSRLSAYAPEGFRNVIPLTESRDLTTVTESTRQELAGGDSASQLSAHDVPNVVQLASPGFRTYDKDKVWVSDTDLEIFRLTYSSENGMTVKSENGDKLIAPGTSEEYVFTLENTGDVPLAYDMTMSAKVTGTDLELPVKVNVHDHTDRYILGSSDTLTKVDSLNSVAEHSQLSAGRFAVYTLKWEWPFEWDNDDYDTMLGNMAVDDDLALTIRINTYASYDEEAAEAPAEKQEEHGLEAPYSPVASPKTGVALGMIPVILTAALIAMFVMRPKNRKDEETET
ncbi:hypothetical protein [Ruminococcus sp. XPD3002]|uniref:hypothetical protein n=1 Tax=Ruminococcus sp. XPD3002 TaxID=1452269 RepID=UPI00091EB824|nr:hypothetical protein SAMN04487832_11199 [Ruminococcus flavefaciens]